MKRSLFPVLIIGVFLAAGISGYLVLHRTGSAVTATSEKAAVSEPVESAVSGSPAQPVPPDVPPQRSSVVKKSGIEEPALQVVAAPGDRFQPVAEAQILDRRVETVSKDQKKRELLVKAGGKYPFHRVEEMLVKNEGADTYTIASRTEMVADHVLVKLQDGKGEADLRTILGSYGVSTFRKLSLPGHYIVSLKAPTLDAVKEAVSVLSAESAVFAYVEPDYLSHIAAVPNDTRWSELWGMVKINATGAWDFTTGSTNVVVAVLDTGISLAHPDLSPNLWKNTAEVNGAPGVDDDGNGYIDDTSGWDFVNADNIPDDDAGHGTHCAGTIGAVGNNAKGVAGVCWSVRLMALKVLDASGSGREGGWESDIANAIQYASDEGAKIISASLGGYSYSDTARDAIAYANSKGVLFVAAAGNGGADGIGDNNDVTPVYPAGYDLPNIVAVAATDPGDVLAGFSNYGKTSVDLAAPGVNILSTVPGGGYDAYQGTSMATPHVAGAAALLLSAKPALTHLQLKAALLSTVDPVSALAGKTVSGGRLNVQRLISLQDTDGDGIPDDWESANGLNPNNPLDALLDPDGDHLNNRGEYENRCITTNADTDADTLVDGWEVTYGFNPNSPTGGLSRSSSLGGINLSGEAKNIVVAGSYAYVAAGSAGLVILNVSNPEHPVLAGSYDTAGTANDVAVNNGYAYVADGSDGLVIINVSTPTSPFLAGSIDTAGTATGISVQSNYVYLADGTAKTMVVFDVSNPAVPVFKWSDNSLQQAMYDVFACGNSVYIAANANVYRMNISNPAVPVWTTNSANLIGWQLTGIHGNGSVVAAVGGTRGVTIMNDTSIQNRTVLGSYDTAGTASGVFVDGNYVYVADGTNGLVVLDVSTPSAPFLSAHITTAGSASGVFVSGGLTYVTEGAGVEIFSILSDSDGDGLLDSWEMTWFGNLSRDGTGDFDNDGISDRGEYLAGLNPKNPDQDADGLIDGTQEVRIYNTDPRVADTDGDGLADGDEVSRGTNPLLVDTDGDGMKDGWEVTYGFDPLDILNPGASGDADSDGLTNLEESQNGTAPNNPDTDGDGMKDGWEVAHNLNPLLNDAALDPDSDGLTNLQEYILGTDPHNSDSDNDGMPDGWENSHGFNPLVNDASGDADSDALTNLQEYQQNTNPHNNDTDGDGMPDGWEVSNGLNPLLNDASGDPDSDKLLNIQEYSLCSSSLWQTVYSSVTGSVATFSFGIPGSTNPQKADSDGDGLTDYYEITTNAASGNLYITNPNSKDTDGDGLPDNWELSQTPVSDPTVPALPGDDSDGDGLTNGEEAALGTQMANRNDPVFVDDDAPNDPWPMDPQSSDTNENGTISHPFDAIQEAVNVATNGLTVLVADGTYMGEGNYNINPHGKSIRIISWNNSPTSTVVNSLGYGPVFVMNSGETTNSLLKGLGITVTLSDCSDGECDFEHAIVLSNASPRVENCQIYDGQLNGIYCVGGSSPVIRNCTISRFLNGIWCEGGSSLRIENCKVSESAYRGRFQCDLKSRGIGIYADSNGRLYIGGDSVVSGCQSRGVIVKNCADAVIEDTDVTGCGGGITCDGSSPRIERCIISDNEALNYYMYKSWYKSERVLFPLGESDYIELTDEDENGGGVLLLRSSSPVMVNCLISGNRTWAEDPDYSGTKLVPDYGLGGGIYIGDGCSPTGVNCTVVDNHANTRGGGLSSFQSPFLRNMIFWGNTCSNVAIVESARIGSPSSPYRNLHCRSGSINIWYSDIQYGYPTAVLSSANDPLFVGGGNYHLSTSNSPCYNKGTFYLAPLLDLDGNVRPTALPGRVDMGCYEFGAIPPAPDAAADPDVAAASTGGAAPDPLADSDGDGFSNGAEMTAGTDIYDRNDYFRASSEQSHADGSVLISWQSITGSRYTVQFTGNLASGTWSNVAGYTDLPGTGSVMSFSEKMPGTVRYYRVLVRQP